MENKKRKWFQIRNYIAVLISAAVTVVFFILWRLNTGNEFFRDIAIMFFVVSIVNILMVSKNRSAVNKGIKEVDSFPLMNGEKIVKEYNGITVDGFAFLSYQKMFFKNIVVTNKRIAMSSNYFGVETYTTPMSMYYKKEDYRGANRMTSLLVYSVNKKGESVYVKGKGLSIFSITWKIKDIDSMYEIIKSVL